MACLPESPYQKWGVGRVGERSSGLDNRVQRFTVGAETSGATRGGGGHKRNILTPHKMGGFPMCIRLHGGGIA